MTLLVLKKSSVKGTQETCNEATDAVKVGLFVTEQFSTNKATDGVKLGLLVATGHPARGSST